MYVLDTNAFYYAAGISECTYDVEKLRELVRQNEVFLSTTSLFEFLIKYQKDIETVRLGGKYLWENHIRLASNVINPLPEHFVDDLINITEPQLQLMCAEILDNKIGQHRTIAEASAVESPIRQETIGFPAHFFARAHNFKPPGRACQPEADSPMRT